MLSISPCQYLPGITSWLWWALCDYGYLNVWIIGRLCHITCFIKSSIPVSGKHLKFNTMSQLCLNFWQGGKKKVPLTKLSKTHSALNFLGQLDNETCSLSKELLFPHSINRLLDLLDFFLAWALKWDFDKKELHSKWVSSVNNKFSDETLISRQAIWKAMLFWWDMEWVVIFVNYKRNKLGLLLQCWDNIVTESKILFSHVLWRALVWPGTLSQAALHFRTLMGNKPINMLTNSFKISGAKSKVLL